MLLIKESKSCSYLVLFSLQNLWAYVDLGSCQSLQFVQPGLWKVMFLSLQQTGTGEIEVLLRLYVLALFPCLLLFSALPVLIPYCCGVDWWIEIEICLNCKWKGVGLMRSIWKPGLRNNCYGSSCRFFYYFFPVADIENFEKNVV